MATCQRCNIDANQPMYSSRMCRPCKGITWRNYKRASMENFLKASYSQIISRSKRKGMPPPMEIDEFMALCGARCPITNVEYSITGPPEALPSPDRISNDRAIGYTANNVRWCLWAVNRLKQSREDSEFLEFCERANADLSLWPADIRALIEVQRRKDAANSL